MMRFMMERRYQLVVLLGVALTLAGMVVAMSGAGRPWPTWLAVIGAAVCIGGFIAALENR